MSKATDSIIRPSAVAVATCGGVGFLPGVPATYGSAVGVFLYWAGPAAFPPRLAAAGALVLVGFWASRHAVERFRDQDPRPVVIDEVAAQYLALLVQGAETPLGLLASFLLFRVLDVLKPFGIRRLERYPGGVGVMADDLAAGLLGGLALRAASLLGLPL